ncbi:unnamed protein product [Phaedon cochleariae]|uniref:NAD(+) ADP-ribosyltransferase n=1 Tax=Phaedon cochleariae TaxID=80249 RepID=A0A9N9SBS4_PHACE|nr:unnamed protein product [Phaedon cochleariae]
MDLPYKAEYAKTGRASCKGCKSPISQGELRIAVLVQRPKTTDDIDHFESLRIEDQDRIRSRVGVATTAIVPDKKGKKRAADPSLKLKQQALQDFEVQYSKSGRAMCQGCEIKILKDEVRISKKDFDTEIGRKYGGQPMWHHVNCFAQVRSSLGFYECGDKLPGFKTLSPDDQKNVKAKIPCDLKVARIEVESSKRLVSELERTVGYQQRVIELLDAKTMKYPNTNKECAVASSLSKSQIPDDSQSSSKKFSEDDIDPKNHCMPNLDTKSKKNGGRTSVIDKKEVNSAILLTETQSTLNHYINLTDDKSKQHDTIMEKQGEWQTVHPKKNRKRKNLIVGENTEKIKGVPKFTYLHVCRVDPATTSQDLICQLKTVFPEVTCESLNSKHPTIYSSFKLLDQLADLMTFGVLARCKTCKGGQLVFSKGGYTCTGDLTQWTKCTEFVRVPKRKTFKVPPDLQERYPFLKKYKTNRSCCFKGGSWEDQVPPQD